MYDDSSNDYVLDQIIVGFTNKIYSDNAFNILKNCNGFRGILKKYDSTPLVLVEVNPGFLTRFRGDALKIKGIEFCNLNYYLKPASYEDIIYKGFQENRYRNSDIHRIHSIQKNFDRNGVGIRIALIDTGMSCHPCLPSTSFQELKKRQAKVNFEKSLYDDFLRNLIGIENAYSYMSKDKGKNSSFVKELENEIVRFHEEVWKDWSQKTYQNSLFAPQSTFEQPIFHSVLGYLKKTSIYSYNFVDKNLDIRDGHGHGTSIAGVFCGERPHETKNVFLAGSDILGIVPYAEYMILKIYDAEKKQSTVDLLIEALDYCCNLDIDIDLIYCGLVSDSAPVSESIAIDKLINQLNRGGAIFVCPAGNGSKNKLSMPANLSASISVTSIYEDDSKKLVISPESNYASKQLFEEVDFCALGGDVYKKISSTDINFGYSKKHGTSIAAAIVTGLIARNLSESYKEKMDKDYFPVFLSNSLNSISATKFTAKRLPKDINKFNNFIWSIKNTASNQSCFKYQMTPEFIGSGCISDYPSVLMRDIWI